MNSTEFKGDWEELKQKIRKEFAELTKEVLKLTEVQNRSDADESAGNPAEKTQDELKKRKDLL